MNKREEKAIRGLECCVSGSCNECPYQPDGLCDNTMMHDALSLLREPEQPKEVIGMSETCTDNRFEIIANYKHRLIEETNIETKPEEMAVLDSILFRFWQMGWLKEQEPMKPIFDEKDVSGRCGVCGHALTHQSMVDDVLVEEWFQYCPLCGTKVDWNA